MTKLNRTRLDHPHNHEMTNQDGLSDIHPEISLIDGAQWISDRPCPQLDFLNSPPDVNTDLLRCR